MASLSAVFESDIKKIVALSTLSQLGVIIIAVSAGRHTIAFFHLISHAFFKALIFIAAGSLIHGSLGSQDLRSTGTKAISIPFSSSVVVVTSARLGGLPFIAAFYSKEAVIELLLISPAPDLVLILLVLGVCLTLIYSSRFFFLTRVNFSLRRRLFIETDLDLFVVLAALTLLVPAIVGGALMS